MSDITSGHPFSKFSVSRRPKALFWTLISTVVLALITFSWLAIPYAVNGVSLLTRTGETVQEERREHSMTLSQFLSRQAYFPGGIEVKTLFANETYFDLADRGNLAEYYAPQDNYVFFITEDVHTGLLPFGQPDATLRIGDAILKPILMEGPAEASHHRMTIAAFPKLDADGEPYLQDGQAGELRLILRHKWDRSMVMGDTVQPVMTNLVWRMPMEVPAEMLEKPGIGGAIAASLSVGLLAAVLTPCLLQLSVVFMATMSASGAEAVSTSGGVTRTAQKRILVAASAFVLGYIILFTMAGALIGGLGKQAQIAFAVYSRPVAIGSGILVILFGLRLGIRSNAPMLCKLPGAALMQRMKGGSTFGNVMIAIVYNLGCMSCFGGAIIATLFIYVGALGSAWTGAVTMGAFALGLGVPFLVAALFFSRVEPLILAVSKYRRGVGLVSSLVVIGFGVLLVTDNFHTLSDQLYPLLGLG